MKTKLQNGVLNSAIRKRSSASYSATSLKDIESPFAQSLNYSSAISLGIPLFSVNWRYSFESQLGDDYKNYLNSYFFHYYDCSTIYNFTLPNTIDFDTYRSGLSNSYVSELDKLFSNKVTSDSFFGTYGTHIVSKASYGANCDIYYGLLTNTPIPDSSDNDINDIESKDHLASSPTKEYFYSRAVGGNPFEGTGASQLDSLVKKWSQSIESNPVLVKMDNLIPLWNILPDKYNDSEHIQEFKNYFVSYANDNKDLYLKKTQRGPVLSISDDIIQAKNIFIKK